MHSHFPIHACTMQLVQYPIALSKVLLAVDWTVPSQVAKVHRLLPQWATPGPAEALQVTCDGVLALVCDQSVCEPVADNDNDNGVGSLDV